MVTRESFAVGDRVMWSSQAAGVSKYKSGTVVAIVPAYDGVHLAHAQPYWGWPWSIKFPVTEYSYKHLENKLNRAGKGRDHESYLIAVRDTEFGKLKLYWPRVSALKLVHRPGAALPVVAPDGQPYTVVDETADDIAAWGVEAGVEVSEPVPAIE